MVLLSLMSANLSDILKTETASLHAKAEKTGIVRQIIAGQIDKDDYAVFLRNLLPAYEQLEMALDHNRHLPALAEISLPAIYRAKSAAKDLVALSGPEWSKCLPVLNSATCYADQIAAAHGPALIAHAYTRYLGDLNGGRIFKKILQTKGKFREDALNFFDYPALNDLTRSAADYRRAIDRAGALVDDWEAIVVEAQRSFERNIEISNDVLAFSRTPV